MTLHTPPSLRRLSVTVGPGARETSGQDKGGAPEVDADVEDPTASRDTPVHGPLPESRLLLLPTLLASKDIPEPSPTRPGAVDGDGGAKSMSRHVHVDMHEGGGGVASARAPRNLPAPEPLSRCRHLAATPSLLHDLPGMKTKMIHHAPWSVNLRGLGRAEGGKCSALAVAPAPLDLVDPPTHAAAIARPEASQWLAAAKEELRSLADNGTWVLGPLPPGRRAIGCKWVFKLKKDDEGRVARYKARLVARGFSQVPGLDFEDTFAPVARYDTMRLLLNIACMDDLDLYQMDVKTAYLNGDLDEDLYMRQPEGFVVPGSEHLVCHLKRPLYGLRQAGRAWNTKLHAVLTAGGMSRSSFDHCLYFKRAPYRKVIFVLTYVDDIIIASNCPLLVQGVKTALTGNFTMTDQGELKFILGMLVTRNRGQRKLALTQTAYITSILTRFGMGACKPALTPDTIVRAGKAESKEPAQHHFADQDEIGGVSFREVVGTLSYAANATRPDIYTAVRAIASNQDKPLAADWRAAKRIMRYLSGTRHLGIIYGASRRQGEQPALEVFCDASYASCPTTMRSTTGYLVQLDKGIVSWHATRQKTVALSSAEAEYMALSDACKEAVWFRGLLLELGLRRDDPVTIFEDNQAAIEIATNPKDHSRTKHVAIRYHHIRERVANGEVRLKYIPTSEQVADALTKPLAAPAFSYLRSKMPVALLKGSVNKGSD